MPRAEILSEDDETIDLTWEPPFVPRGVDDILASLPQDHEIQAWRNPAVHQRVLQCVEAEANLRHTFRDAVNIEAVHTDKVHYYKYKGKAVKWPSPSRFNDGITFPKFDEEYVANQRAKTKNEESEYFGMKAVDIKAKWRQTAVDGRGKHAVMDMRIQHPEQEIPEEIPETLDTSTPLAVPTFMKRVDPTPAFYRCLAHILREFVIWATEVTLYDEEWEVVGQTDVILQCRQTGQLVIADWKNCGTDDLGDPAKAYGKMGCHPSTAHLLATKLNKYLVQTSIYRKLAKRRTHGEWPPFAKRVILYNFNPKTPDLYEIKDRPCLDLQHLFRLLPYRADDPRHGDYSILPTLVPRLGTIPLPPSQTQRVKIGPYMWCQQDVAWVGSQYPSRNAKRETDEAMEAACEAGDVARMLELFHTYRGKVEKYNLRSSPYHHPMDWDMSKDPVRLGYMSYYEWWLLNTPRVLAMLPQFVGKRIACWCAEGADQCHAEILTRYVQAWETRVWRPDLDQFNESLSARQRKKKEDEKSF
jgi:hypothetical protein